MATLCNALNTMFTPAAGDFIVQATGGEVVLQRQNTSSAAWAPIGVVRGAQIVSNPVAGANYQFVAASAGTPLVQADQ